MKKFIYVSDVHIPYHDEEACKDFFAACEKVRPDTVILGGDMVDFFKLSRWDKSPLEGDRFDHEVQKTKDFFTVLRKFVPKRTKVYWVEGNHEERLIKYLKTKAPELIGWKQLEIPQLFELEKFDIEWVPDRRVLQIDEWVFRHGHEGQYGSSVPGNNARKGVAAYGAHYIQGHIHRGNIIHVSNYNGDYIGVENPCLCADEPGYVKGYAGWQQGFTIGTKDKKDRWQIKQIIL